jgi:hypothetical protein
MRSAAHKSLIDKGRELTKHLVAPLASPMRSLTLSRNTLAEFDIFLDCVCLRAVYLRIWGSSRVVGHVSAILGIIQVMMQGRQLCLPYFHVNSYLFLYVRVTC